MKLSLNAIFKKHQQCHSRENGNPAFSLVVSLTFWIPDQVGNDTQDNVFLKKAYLSPVLFF